MWDDDKHHRVIDKQVSLLDVKEEALKNLKACPFCGCELKDFNGFTIVEKWHLKADTYRIVCPRCGAAGPDASEIEWAGANWDSRARRGKA